MSGGSRKKEQLLSPVTGHQKNGKVFIIESAEKVAEFTAIKWMEIAQTAISETGRFTVALSGGKTPVALYHKLADLQKPLAWDKTHIFLVDERFVPFDSEESNYGMIRRVLLSRVDIPDGNIHPIDTRTASAQQSAERYEEELKSFFGITENEFPRMNLLLLGMGEDGHTASLFPGTEALRERDRLAVAPPQTEQTRRQRISLTLPLINSGENVIFMVTGKSKAAVVRDVVEREVISVPASMVRPDRGNLFFFLDEQAGSLLIMNKP